MQTGICSLSEHDPGPAPATIYEMWRSRPKGGAWSAWIVDGIYRGKLSTPTYKEDGSITIDIQRVFNDIWRGHLQRWTGTDQKKRMIPNPDFDSNMPESEANPKEIPNEDDTGLDRADLARRSGLLVGWQA